MAELEKHLAHQWFEQVWNQGRREAIAQLLSPDAVLLDGGMETRGLAGFTAFFDRMTAAPSDMRISVEDTISEGDRVCIRWRVTARHTGGGLGVPPSNAPIDITGISIIRVRDGKIIAGWQNWDMLAMMEQIKSPAKLATYITAP